MSAPELRLPAISEFDGWLRARTNKHDLPYQEDTITAYKEAARALHRWMTKQQIDDAELDTIPEAIARLTRGFVLTGSKYVALARSGYKPPDASQTQQDLAEPVYPAAAPRHC